MSLVAKSLHKPYTSLVAAILILVLGMGAVVSTPTDVFPVIDLPVASVIWAYGGASPNDMEKRIVTVSERSYTTAVNDIEHIESQSMPGVSVIKVFFQPGANVAGAVAQLTATSQTLLKQLPPGITPPLIIQYSASSVPILQLGVSSDTMSEAQIYDYAQNFVRVQLATVRGAATPSPYGGKPRQIMVDINPQELQAKGLTPIDVTNAVNAQNLILPSGTAKMGSREYTISLNSSPDAVKTLNELPIKTEGGALITVGDVAQVHDGYAVQTNVVDVNGRRAVLLTILKSGNASTLAVVDRVKELLPKIQSTLPPGLKIQIISDQSVFVKASILGVVREAVLAALLTSVMILFFLGSWRSTLIVALGIPLAILASIIALSAMGQTLNVMTLGGLALAIGILVDNAIVLIENIYRNLGLGKNLRTAILDGTEQIAAPSLVATLAICIVFVPILMLSGATGSLFKPLALAVVFAMLASYLLSRTFVPVVVDMLLGKEVHLHAHGHESGSGHPPDGTSASPTKGDVVWRTHLVFNRYFDMLLGGYRKVLVSALASRKRTLLVYGLIFLSAIVLTPFVGQDFFPSVDAGSFRLHVRAPAGTRIEETERYFQEVTRAIRKTIPGGEVRSTLANIGLPVGGVNFAYNTTGAIGPSDGEILVALGEERSRPTEDYIDRLRQDLPHEFPQLTFFFQPADITTQILNFGLPAPIDIQVTGNDRKNFEIAKEIAAKVKLVEGAADVHIHQVVDEPELRINVDRQKADSFGFTQRDVAGNLLVSLSSSGQNYPNFWLDPKNGVSYLVAVQTPQHLVDSIASLQSTPIEASGKPEQLLTNLSTIQRRKTLGVINHYNVAPTFDVYANVQNRDLGSVSADINRILAKIEPSLPHGTSLAVRGQVQSMNTSFTSLGIGLAFSILFIALLLVVNFQSMKDPLIIISALPGALSGIVWFLFVAHTPFSVPALMGAIMCIGVSTANSILVVTFANDRLAAGDEVLTAAIDAGCTRLRPVLMTAAAMILGMLPMALAMGEGGEQNAPLGRAVIGGLLLATVSTLIFVPVIFSLLHRAKKPADSPSLSGTQFAMEQHA
jgi:multidrug efflux pump subunit AcrB